MMKYILLLFIFFTLEVFSNEASKPLKKLTVKEKKKRFYSMVVPAVKKVYNNKYEIYNSIYKDIEHGTNNAKIKELKEYYKVATDQELLMALKPQPKSIAIAQAAIESAWGTSRFFRAGNNLFGMWSISAKEQRIAAGVKRDNNTTVWIKKYNTIEDSIRGYYLTLAKGKRYKKMRELNYNSKNVYEIVQGLDRYSERGKAYVEELIKIIRHNKLTQYDKM